MKQMNQQKYLFTGGSYLNGFMRGLLPASDSAERLTIHIIVIMAVTEMKVSNADPGSNS